ncbi:hypothetical protein C8J57DRAFT_1558065 [Mycena rebaudengoi]|nr:hypothetical protein C8J57DRAFT_1558065 [Mycena rebaudengoi]
MHRAWDIAEIVQMVCEHVALDGPADWRNGRPVEKYPKRRRDLSRLARTSTIFMNPALAFLWQYQATLLHLLRTMPNDLWDIAKDSTVTNADWTRFVFYSRRVKSFTDNHVVLGASEVYETLAASFPQDFIFPNLQTLDWYPISTELFHHVRLFLSPGLTRLQLTMECIPDALILEPLTAKFRDLKDISICGAAQMLTSISRFICVQRDVETLVVIDLDSMAYSHIARFPRLRHLWLRSSKPTPYLQPPTDLPHFPALQALECELRPRPSHGLYFDKADRSRTLFRTHDELHSFITSTTPRRESWRSDVIHPDQLTLYLVTGEELKSLFYFRNLVEFLKTLFDATIVPEFKIRSKRRVSQEHLVDFDVAYLLIGTKPRRVAKFLGTIFPCLEWLRTFYDEHPESRADAQVVASHRAWLNVTDYLGPAPQSGEEAFLVPLLIRVHACRDDVSFAIISFDPLVQLSCSAATLLHNFFMLPRQIPIQRHD